MGFLGAGLLAAAAAFILNRYLVGVMGEGAIAKLIPAVEEILKTGSALLWGTSIPFTHGVFGAVEAIHEIQASPRGLWSGIMAFINHLFYGIVTLAVMEVAGGWFWGLAGAIALHTLWNWIIMEYAAKG